MLKYLRYLLWPFSVIYGAVIAIRNKSYDWLLLKSVKFDLPVLVVGNLAVGGAGKSPMTEFLARLLSTHYKVAILSRGYGRNTTGFLYVEKDDDAKKVGDEPLQFKRKFPETTVSVCEDRVEGVRKLKDKHDLIVLDDAFQHRALTPGLSILLFDYESLFQPRLLLPAGNFRDTFRQRKRADVLIVTKSPEKLSEKERKTALKILSPLPGQNVFFSFLKYGKSYPLYSIQERQMLMQESIVLLITGIANPKPLLNHLQKTVTKVVLMEYPDHYYYTEKDIVEISATFRSLGNVEKVIVTTEKDAQRLKIGSIKALTATLPIIVIPVEATFGDRDANSLSEMILSYCAENVPVKTNHHKRG